VREVYKAEGKGDNTTIDESTFIANTPSIVKALDVRALLLERLNDSPSSSP